MKETMLFHGFGSVSKEKLNIIFQNEDILVLSESDEEITVEDFNSLDRKSHEFDSGESYWIFNKKTKKCLNDETAMGCHRTLK